MKESEWILALAAVPPSAGKVRAVDHTSALAEVRGGWGGVRRIKQVLSGS